MDDANRLSDANRRLIGQHAPMIDTEWETIPLLQVELDVLLNTARSEGRKAADTALSERVAELERGLEGGWLPIVLCPTDGAWRLVKLPDGQEVVASFDGGLLGARRWRTRTFGYHNPARPTGEKRGGVEQMTAPYDTVLVGDLPANVYPTHFRPNDTVHGIAAQPKDINHGQ